MSCASNLSAFFFVDFVLNVPNNNGGAAIPHAMQAAYFLRIYLTLICRNSWYVPPYILSHVALMITVCNVGYF